MGGIFKTVYTAGALNATQCRINIEIFSVASQQVVQELTAKVNYDVTVVKNGTDKYEISFSNTQFGILPGGTATRVVSATAFGCP